jgi:hypothetical protein
MTRNPYSPPTSTVTDIDTSIPIARPREVRIAVVLCWISLVVALPAIYEDFSGPEPAVAAALYVGLGSFYVALLAFAIWLIVMIGRARNWARIVYAVLTGLNLIAVFGDIPGTFAGPWYSWSASLLSTAMDLAIVVLLFRPASNAWYRVRGRRPADSAA